MQTPVKALVLLIFILGVIACLAPVVEGSGGGQENQAAGGHPHNPRTREGLAQTLREYDLKKQKRYREKFCYNQQRVNENLPYHRLCPDFNRNHLKFYFSLFIVIAIGAALRTFLRVFEISLPYTVVLMILGMLFGLITDNKAACTSWSMYTRIARTPARVILFVFLPVLIYESAFSMNAHTFYRAVLSILILALPGMLIATFITAFICNQFFFSYNWSFMVASLFGAIVSATDPVAVVAILKEIGTTETLGIMIEGESLLNDGIAILFYQIFLGVVKSELHESEHPDVDQGAEIVKMFCRICFGGPAFGYLMAKISIWFLSRIFNDAPVEVSITIVAAYLTYFIGEGFFGVSGVMAVVALGIVMSAERTCISPEVQGLAHHFWEMIGYFANTVLFVIVGVVITETAINSATIEDLYYLIFLYFAINIARLLMMVVLSPILTNVGYGLSWQNMLVMCWGGLRGAIGICLSLEVYHDRDLCEHINIGPKYLLQTAGIVLLTLLINGTTTKALLKMLKLTELSVGKIQDMQNAVRQIQGAQKRAVAVMQHDRFLADCNWVILESYTTLENPYAKHNVHPKEVKEDELLEASPSLLIEATDHRMAICPTCDTEVEAEPNADEYRELTEESRLRLIKAMKVSCWRQFDQGTLTEEAVQILIVYLDNLEDRHFQMFHANELKKYWEVHGVIAWLRNKMLPIALSDVDEEDVPEEPESPIRKTIYKLILKDWFEGVYQILILLNMVPIVWEAVLIAEEHHFTRSQILGFLIVNVVFTLLFTLEFGLKVTGLGCGGYWSSKWNILDAVVLVVSWVEVILSLAFIQSALDEAKHHEEGDATNKLDSLEFLKFLRFVRLVRLTRIFRLFRPLIPRFMGFLNKKVNTQLFLGYDLAKGSAMAIEDVGKFLSQMIDNPKVISRFRDALEEQRLIILLEMGLIQKDHPGIAIAVKTRHASRAILNQMRESLQELKEDGLVAEKEYEVLLQKIEIKMKRLWNAPSYMPPRPPEMLIADLQWVGGNTDMLALLLKEATLLHFAVGEVIYANGDKPNGIFIVVSGVVKINYQPTHEIVQAQTEKGEIPNIEFFYEPSFEYEMSDYYTSGGVIGEMGVITGANRAATVTCETGVVVYHLSQATMEKALETFDDKYDSLEARLWRAMGMKLAAAVLPFDLSFQAWTIDRIKTHLELSAVPIGDQYLSMNIPEFISDVVVIYGQVVNANNPTEVYTAPCLLPHAVTKIKPSGGGGGGGGDDGLKPRILIIANEEIDHIDHPQEPTQHTPSSDALHQIVLARKKRASIDEDAVMKMNRPSLTAAFGVRPKGSTLSKRSKSRAGGINAVASTTSRRSQRSRRDLSHHQSRSRTDMSNPPPPPSV